METCHMAEHYRDSGVDIRFIVLNPRSASADVISKHANVSLIACASYYSYVHQYTCSRP